MSGLPADTSAGTSPPSAGIPAGCVRGFAPQRRDRGDLGGRQSQPGKRHGVSVDRSRSTLVPDRRPTVTMHPSAWSAERGGRNSDYWSPTADFTGRERRGSTAQRFQQRPAAHQRAHQLPPLTADACAGPRPSAPRPECQPNNLFAASPTDNSDPPTSRDAPDQALAQTPDDGGPSFDVRALNHFLYSLSGCVLAPFPHLFPQHPKPTRNRVFPALLAFFHARNRI
jgi:hypothetical protein